MWLISLVAKSCKKLWNGLTYCWSRAELWTKESKVEKSLHRLKVVRCSTVSISTSTQYMILIVYPFDNTYSYSYLIRLIQSNCYVLGDEQCTWWTNLLTCAILWASGDLLEAQMRYNAVRSIPSVLLADNLALALGNALCAQKLCLENKDKKHYEQLVWMHCCKAKVFIKNASPTPNQPTLERLQVRNLSRFRTWLCGSCVLF